MIMDWQAYLFSTVHSFGRFFGRSFGLLGLRTIGQLGHLDYWPFRLLGFRIIGNSDDWVFGLSSLRTVGPSDYRANTNWKCRFNSQTCFPGIPNSIILRIHCKSIAKSQIKICRRLWFHCISWYELLFNSNFYFQFQFQKMWYTFPI